MMLGQPTKQQPLLSTSLSTVFKLSTPLMLAALSANLMFFFDRLILSRYNLEAMNATASVALILFTFTMAGRISSFKRIKDPPKQIKSTQLAMR